MIKYFIFRVAIWVAEKFSVSHFAKNHIEQAASYEDVCYWIMKDNEDDIRGR